MSKSQRAMISWVSPEDGGRKTLPSGPKYVTVAQFEDDGNWSEGSWSLVVDFEKYFHDGRLLLAQVRFLVDEAPHHLLHNGSRFGLLEGRKRVAKGIILPAKIDIPETVNDFEAALVG